MKKNIACSLLLIALSGCQGALPGINGLSQPGRVPPPATGSYQVPGTYSGATGPAGPSAPRPAGQSAPTVGAMPTGGPMVDPVASAQNQLKQATDSARAAVMQSTQSIQNQVEQAGARADRIGAGVVQASQILNDAAHGTLPPVPPGSPGFASPNAAGMSGSVSDRDTETAADPNAQWRKPTPR
jgi:hypothetical protein